MQSGLAILGFVLVLFWHSWLSYTYFAVLLLPCGSSKALRKSRQLRAVTRKNRLPSLTAALVEFQKAQCFFVLAINIASLLYIMQGGLKPISLQQSYKTFVLIRIILISGYLPITLTLFTLHIVDKVSWYLLVLSFSAVSVSVTTLSAMRTFSPSAIDLEYLSQQCSNGGPVSCGGRDLTVYCYTPPGSHASKSAFNPQQLSSLGLLMFCLIVFAIVTIH